MELKELKDEKLKSIKCLKRQNDCRQYCLSTCVYKYITGSSGVQTENLERQKRVTLPAHFTSTDYEAHHNHRL